MTRPNSRSPLEWLQELSKDILATKIDIDTVPYWNKACSNLEWTPGMYGNRPVALSTLNHAGILQREVIGRNSSFTEKLPPSFFKRDRKNFSCVHVYKIMDMRRLEKLSTCEESELFSLGLGSTSYVIRPTGISYPDALARIKKELAENPDRDKLLLAIVRELSRI